MTMTTKPTATTVNKFGDKLYALLTTKEAGKNIFLSPYSISVALGMCAAGANGETRNVMSHLLGSPSDLSEANNFYKALISEVNGDGSERPFELVTANALWGHVTYKFKEAFKANVASNYGGSFNVVDYQGDPDGAVAAINKWVADCTRNLIPKLIERDFVNDDTRLVLTNAIYFKGKWEVEFDKNRTRDEDFYTASGTKEVPLMYKSGEGMYYEGDGFKALDLPYKGDELSLLVLLPNANDGLTPLELKVANEGTYDQVCKGLYYEETVHTYLPRFKSECSFKLKPALVEMGAGLAFSDMADFSGIGDDPLKISEVVHKAFVQVDEEGTEAAAATAVGMMRCTAVMRPNPPKVFRADHPFLFFIRNKATNTVLFQGRYLGV
jgi:serpin B